MDFFKNENYSCSTESIHQNSSTDSSVLKDDLKQLKFKQLGLEEKLSDYESLISEKKDLIIQLENLEKSIKDAKENQNKFFDDFTKELANTSIISEELSAIHNTVIKSENENQELEDFLRAQTSQETQIVDEIEQLECIHKKSKKQNDELHKKQVQDRKRVELENAIARKSSEAAKCRDDLTAAETDVKTESKRLVALQRRNAECDRTTQRLTAERADREAELVAFGDVVAERLSRAASCAYEAGAELAAARAALAGRAADRRRAADALCELQAASDVEAHRWRAAVHDLVAEGDRLSDRLSEASACVVATMAHNLRLADCARGHAARLADLTAEADGLAQRTGQERVVHAARRVKFDGDTALLEDEIAAKRNAIDMVRREIDDVMHKRNVVT